MSSSMFSSEGGSLASSIVRDGSVRSSEGRRIVSAADGSCDMATTTVKSKSESSGEEEDVKIKGRRRRARAIPEREESRLDG